MAHLWPDTAVQESNLSQQIFTLRRVLGEKPEDRQYIATVPRRGYRFVAEVTCVESNDAVPLEPTGADPPSSPGSSVGLEGERKQVTALFCRFANAAAMAERLGHAEMHARLGRALQVAAQQVHRYGGIGESVDGRRFRRPLRRAGRPRGRRAARGACGAGDSELPAGRAGLPRDRGGRRGDSDGRQHRPGDRRQNRRRPAD